MYYFSFFVVVLPVMVNKDEYINDFVVAKGYERAYTIQSVS